MEMLAWVLKSDPKKNTIGFVKPETELRHLLHSLDWDEEGRSAVASR
jgi:hypothetical protein